MTDVDRVTYMRDILDLLEDLRLEIGLALALGDRAGARMQLDTMADILERATAQLSAQPATCAVPAEAPRLRLAGPAEAPRLRLVGPAERPGAR